MYSLDYLDTADKGDNDINILSVKELKINLMCITLYSFNLLTVYFVVPHGHQPVSVYIFYWYFCEIKGNVGMLEKIKISSH